MYCVLCCVDFVIICGDYTVPSPLPGYNDESFILGETSHILFLNFLIIKVSVYLVFKI